MKTKNNRITILFFSLPLLIWMLIPTLHLSASTSSSDVRLTGSGYTLTVSESVNLDRFVYNENEFAVYTFAADKPIQGTPRTLGSVRLVVKDACLSLCDTPLNLAVNEQKAIFIYSENKKTSYKITSSNPSIVSVDSKRIATGKKAELQLN